MEGLIALHSDIWAIMLFTGACMLYTMYSVLYNCYVKATIKEHSLIEIIWAVVPAIILFRYTLFSSFVQPRRNFLIKPSLTVQSIGRQWFCFKSDKYGDYDVCDGLVTNNLVFDSNVLQDDDHINQFMASPQESTNSWFSPIKSWWYGSNKLLTPVEAAQKNIALSFALRLCPTPLPYVSRVSRVSRVDKHSQSELSRCINLDKDIDVSSPRSVAIIKHKQEECFGHVTRLQKCTNQMHQNSASTNYGATEFNEFNRHCSR